MTSFFKLIKLTGLILFMFLSANFALNNQNQIPVNLGPFAETINVKLYIFAFSLCILGSLTTSLYFVLDSLKKTLIVKKQSRIIKKLEKINSSPIDDITVSSFPPSEDPNSVNIDHMSSEENFAADNPTINTNTTHTKDLNKN